MKKLLLIQITILMSAFSFAKIEVLDRVAIIVDEKTSGTQSGTFTSGSFQQRDLNTKLSDPDKLKNFFIHFAKNKTTFCKIP